MHMMMMVTCKEAHWLPGKVRVAALCGRVQRRPPVVVWRVYVGAVSQEDLCYFCVPINTNLKQLHVH